MTCEEQKFWTWNPEKSFLRTVGNHKQPSQKLPLLKQLNPCSSIHGYITNTYFLLNLVDMSYLFKKIRLLYMVVFYISVKIFFSKEILCKNSLSSETSCLSSFLPCIQMSPIHLEILKWYKFLNSRGWQFHGKKFNFWLYLGNSVETFGGIIPVSDSVEGDWECVSLYISLDGSSWISFLSVWKALKWEIW